MGNEASRGHEQQPSPAGDAAIGNTNGAAGASVPQSGGCHHDEAVHTPSKELPSECCTSRRAVQVAAEEDSDDEVAAAERRSLHASNLHNARERRLTAGAGALMLSPLQSGPPSREQEVAVVAQSKEWGEIESSDREDAAKERHCAASQAVKAPQPLARTVPASAALLAVEAQRPHASNTSISTALLVRDALQPNASTAPLCVAAPAVAVRRRLTGKQRPPPCPLAAAAPAAKRRRLRGKQPPPAAYLEDPPTGRAPQAGGARRARRAAPRCAVPFALQYKILGLAPGATLNQVKVAYRKKALETHPDKGGRNEAFAEVQDAYETLLAVCENVKGRQRRGAGGGERARPAAAVVLIYQLLELDAGMWPKRFRKSSSDVLEAALQWAKTRANGLSEQDMRAFKVLIGRKSGPKPGLFSKDGWYWVVLQKKRLKCMTRMTRRLSEAINWHSELLHNMHRFTVQIDAGIPFEKAALVLNDNGLCIKFQNTVQVLRTTVTSPFTFDLSTAMLMRRAVLALSQQSGRSLRKERSKARKVIEKFENGVLEARRHLQGTDRGALRVQQLIREVERELAGRRPTAVMLTALAPQLALRAPTP